MARRGAQAPGHQTAVLAEVRLAHVGPVPLDAALGVCRRPELLPPFPAPNPNDKLQHHALTYRHETSNNDARDSRCFEGAIKRY